MDERENDDTSVGRWEEKEDIRDTRPRSSYDGMTSETLSENSKDASNRNLGNNECLLSKSPFSPRHDQANQPGHVTTISPTINSEASKEQKPSRSIAGSETRTALGSSIQEIENRLKALRSDTKRLDEEHTDAKFEINNFQSSRLYSLLTQANELVVSSNKDQFSQTDNYIDDLPSSPPNNTSLAENSTDGGHSTKSCSSASSLSRSYLFGSASIDSRIPDPRDEGYGDRQILVPKYKPNGEGYCWPTDVLPLGGNSCFDENKQWKPGSFIGKGTSGECYRVSTNANAINSHPPICVQKVFKYNREEVLSLYLSAKDQKRPVSDANTGSHNIIPFYGATYWKKEVRIFMEYMEGGTVQDLIKKEEFGNGLPKYQWMEYISDILSALTFLHSKGIAHNDVKAANVLLGASSLQAKLADFGNASPLYDTTQAQQKRQDVWAAGCFLLEMLGQQWCDCRRLPVPQNVNKEVGLPIHCDKDTNNVLQLFFKDIEDQYKQYNAYDILTKAKKIIEPTPSEITLDNEIVPAENY